MGQKVGKGGHCKCAIHLCAVVGQQIFLLLAVQLWVDDLECRTASRRRVLAFSRTLHLTRTMDTQGSGLRGTFA